MSIEYLTQEYEPELTFQQSLENITWGYGHNYRWKQWKQAIDIIFNPPPLFLPRLRMFKDERMIDKLESICFPESYQGET